MAANGADLLSRIGLGCYALGGGYGNVTEPDAEATVDAAIACGWTLVDTAESYLDSEYRLGRILKSRRDDVFLATKVFPCEPYNEHNIVTAAEASLRRLQTDRIDLYQLHGPEDWVRPYATPLDEVAGALNRLVHEGKILRVGACNFPVAVLEELSKHVRLFSLQDLYGPLDPGADQDLPNIPSVTKKLQFAADHGIAFLAYSPLARGLLRRGPTYPANISPRRRATLPPSLPARGLRTLCRTRGAARQLGRPARPYASGAGNRMVPAQPDRHERPRRGEIPWAGPATGQCRELGAERGRRGLRRHRGCDIARCGQSGPSDDMGPLS